MDLITDLQVINVGVFRVVLESVRGHVIVCLLVVISFYTVISWVESWLTEVLDKEVYRLT